MVVVQNSELIHQLPDVLVVPITSDVKTHAATVRRCLAKVRKAQNRWLDHDSVAVTYWMMFVGRSVLVENAHCGMLSAEDRVAVATRLRYFLGLDA